MHKLQYFRKDTISRHTAERKRKMEKMNTQKAETAEKKLDKEQLESVSGGENSAKEFLCLVYGSHLYDIDGSTAYEIIGSDNVHTVYYNERCKRCGKIRYMKNCSTGKYTEISQQEFEAFSY